MDDDNHALRDTPWLTTELFNTVVNNVDTNVTNTIYKYFKNR